MRSSNENLFRGCMQEAQVASTSLTQAIAGIEASAVPGTIREAQVVRLLNANARAIVLLLSLMDLTEHEQPIWPTQ
jgi:hypothetical protein